MEQENDLQKISDLVDSEIQKIESVQDSIRKLIDALAYGLASKLLDYISMAADIFLSTFIIFCILVVGSFTYKMIGWLPGSDPQITEYINSGSRAGRMSG